MSSLKAHEKIIFEKLLDRGGYVLNFTDPSYSAFFREHGINIDAEKYKVNGQSKMKRLRTFWELESDVLVCEILAALLSYADTLETVAAIDKEKATIVLKRLAGPAHISKETPASTADEFLKQEFSNLNLSLLEIDGQLQEVIEQRMSEIHKSLRVNASLAVIFLCGSTLEGLLLNSASKQPQQFNEAKSAPKDKEEKIKALHDWTLDNLINVAHEVGLLSLDIKKYGHTLKDFRNYIHPRQQAAQGFQPDEHTAKISWQVLQAAIADLSGQRKKSK